jgi:hypothetical protein
MPPAQRRAGGMGRGRGREPPTTAPTRGAGAGNAGRASELGRDLLSAGELQLEQGLHHQELSLESGRVGSRA